MKRVLFALLFGACSAQGAGSVDPDSAQGAGMAPARVGPGDIPTIDVEASVRRMLEESRSRQGAAGSVEAGEEPAKASVRIPAPPVAAPDTREDADGYVPLPEGTITVRTLGDVDTVAKELEEARKREAARHKGAPAK